MIMRGLITQRLGARLAVAAVGVVLGAVIVVIAVALARDIGGDQLGVTEAGFEIAPDFTITSFEGETVALADFADGPVFIYFWASWCLPCEQEAPVIQALWPEYQAAGYSFIGINVLDNPSEAERFVQRHQLTFVSARDEERTVYVDYGVARLPEAFFLRPGLTLSARYSGELTEDDLREQLEAIRPGGEGS